MSATAASTAPSILCVPELQRLRADHAWALLAFEQENRTYFAASVPDRGDDYFTRFEARHRDLLAEQAAGLHFFHVLVGTGGEVLGRANLVDVADGSAAVSYTHLRAHETDSYLVCRLL